MPGPDAAQGLAGDAQIIGDIAEADPLEDGIVLLDELIVSFGGIAFQHFVDAPGHFRGRDGQELTKKGLDAMAFPAEPFHIGIADGRDDGVLQCQEGEFRGGLGVIAVEGGEEGILGEEPHHELFAGMGIGRG